jgi:hypothetical protein
LYILSKDFPEKTDGPVSVPKLFSRFFMAEGSWENGRDLYQYGERWQRAVVGGKTESPVPPSEEPITCGDSLKMLLRRHAPDAWDIVEPEKNREWGNLVHLAMSMINRADQVGKVLRELLEGGLINSEQQDELAALMDGILKDPEISPFFDPAFEVRNEPEILTPGGILYRPDRVLMQNGQATIIDYKTGKQHIWHRDQVIKYASLLEDMNYKVEGGYLLYLNPQPIVLKVI